MYRIYGYIGVALFLVGIFGYLKFQIKDLESQNNSLMQEIEIINANSAVCKANREALLSSLEEQSKALEQYKVDLDKALAKYKQQKSIVPKIIERKSNECKDIIKSLNNVAELDFSKL